jgi:hypothetical protein
MSKETQIRKLTGSRQVLRVFALGSITVVLYWALFHNESLVLDLSSKGHWAFWIPVAIAFVFSFAHGAFTGEFWDVLGIKAKKG